MSQDVRLVQTCLLGPLVQLSLPDLLLGLSVLVVLWVLVLLAVRQGDPLFGFLCGYLLLQIQAAVFVRVLVLGPSVALLVVVVVVVVLVFVGLVLLAGVVFSVVAVWSVPVVLPQDAATGLEHPLSVLLRVVLFY